MINGTCKARRGIAIGEFNVVSADAVTHVFLSKDKKTLCIWLVDNSMKFVELDGKSMEFKEKLFWDFVDFLYPESRQIGECATFFSFPLKLEKDKEIR